MAGLSLIFFAKLVFGRTISSLLIACNFFTISVKPLQFFCGPSGSLSTDQLRRTNIWFQTKLKPPTLNLNLGGIFQKFGGFKRQRYWFGFDWKRERVCVCVRMCVCACEGDRVWKRESVCVKEKVLIKKVNWGEITSLQTTGLWETELTQTQAGPLAGTELELELRKLDTKKNNCSHYRVQKSS